MAVADDIIARESGGNPSARNPRSSAAGAGQFIDSTWLSMLRSRRPDLVASRSPQDLLDLKMDPVLSKEMTQAYADDNNAVLAKAGLPATPGNTYLAHFAGPGGAVKVLSADPATPVADILGAQAVAANPHIRGMSAAELSAWANGGKTQSAVASNPVRSTNPTQEPDSVQPSLGNMFVGLAPQSIPALTGQPDTSQMASLSAGGNGSFDSDSAFDHRTYARQRMKRREVLS